ncbi:phage minor tail protein L, partial [Pasteurella multocida]|nr:phage minor tail protein L [Pasteurella multocida]
MIDLFELDLRGLKDKDGMNGELYRFYAGTNEMLNPIVWQGQEYTPYPVKVDGFAVDGLNPVRPSITFSNLGG